jgi:hypothetical protein
MGRLKFDVLMSGTRITTDEKISSVPHVMLYKDTPEAIRKIHWWSLQEISIEFQGWNETTARNIRKNNEILTDLRISQAFKNEAYILVNSDDMYTYWVYINRPDLFAELVEYCGSEYDVWLTYLRWFH